MESPARYSQEHLAAEHRADLRLSVLTSSIKQLNHELLYSNEQILSATREERKSLQGKASELEKQIVTQTNQLKEIQRLTRLSAAKQLDTADHLAHTAQLQDLLDSAKRVRPDATLSAAEAVRFEEEEDARVSLAQGLLQEEFDALLKQKQNELDREKLDREAREKQVQGPLSLALSLHSHSEAACYLTD